MVWGPDQYFSDQNQYFFDFWGSGGALGLCSGALGEINQYFFHFWGSGWQQNQYLFEVWGSGGQVWTSRSVFFLILGLWGPIFGLRISIFFNSGALGRHRISTNQYFCTPGALGFTPGAPKSVQISICMTPGALRITPGAPESPPRPPESIQISIFVPLGL